MTKSHYRIVDIAEQFLSDRYVCLGEIDIFEAAVDIAEQLGNDGHSKAAQEREITLTDPAFGCVWALEEIAEKRMDKTKPVTKLYVF